MELLAVIIILALLATITTVVVNGVINNSEDSLKNVQISEAKKAAQKYFLDQPIFLEDGGETCVNINDIIAGGYATSDSLIDPKTKQTLVGSIKITYKSNQYYYEYQNTTCPTT